MQPATVIVDTYLLFIIRTWTDLTVSLLLWICALHREPHGHHAYFPAGEDLLFRRTQGALLTVLYGYADVYLLFAWIDTCVYFALVLFLILLLRSALIINGINAQA